MCRIHTFPKIINLMVNVIVRLEIELAYYDVGVQHVSQYARHSSANGFCSWKLALTVLAYCLYVFTQHLHHKQDVTQGQFLW